MANRTDGSVGVSVGTTEPVGVGGVAVITHSLNDAAVTLTAL